jgi:hypothetical protein
MEKWRQAPVNGNLLDVPGIGAVGAKKLSECPDRITNSFQLFGKYLMLKGPDVEGHKVQSLEHNEKFWYFLKGAGISAHRSAIVKAIAEKSATFFRDIVSDRAADYCVWWTCKGVSVLNALTCDHLIFLADLFLPFHRNLNSTTQMFTIPMTMKRRRMTSKLLIAVSGAVLSSPSYQPTDLSCCNGGTITNRGPLTPRTCLTKAVACYSQSTGYQKAGHFFITIHYY